MTTELLLIDLSSLFWQAWHASVNDEISTARNNTVNRVRGIVGKYAKAAICCDSAKSWRKDMAPTYKANRPEKDHAAIEELRQVEEILRRDGNVLWKCETFEADDVIATATAHALKRGWTVVVFTGDKDLCQLVNESVTVLSTRTGDMMGTTEVMAKFAVAPSQMLDYLTLVGDSSDNVLGVRGIGPKRAAELLAKFKTINGIYTALDDKPTDVATPAIVAALLESTETVDLAQKLIALRSDVPIRFEDIDEERKQEPLTKGGEVSDITEDEGAEDAEFIPIDGPPRVAPKPAEKLPDMPKEIARVLPPVRVSYEQGLEPTSLPQALQLANRLHESRLYGKKFQSIDAILAIIIRGRELGWGALASLDAFHSYEGRPMLQAHAIVSLAKKHEDCEYFTCIETTAERCTYETKHRRNPNPTRLTYTLAQAKNAGLLRGGGNWEKRPDEMIRKTCAVQLTRIEYPEAAMGLYSIEELGTEEAA